MTEKTTRQFPRNDRGSEHVVGITRPAPSKLGVKVQDPKETPKGFKEAFILREQQKSSEISK